MTIEMPPAAPSPRIASRLEPLRPEPSVRLWYPAVLGTERCPILLYFSGWPGTSLQNAALLRELVSRGYAVATVQYPAHAPGLSPADYDRQFEMLNRPMQLYSSQAAFDESVAANNERLRRNADDASRVLDRLEALNAGDPARCLTGRLDFGRAGIVGYSFGGAVAAEVRRLDARVKAAVNIDGRHWGTALLYGVPPPYLVIGEILRMPTGAELSSADPATRYEAWLDQVDYANLAKHLRQHGGIQVAVAGSVHSSFDEGTRRSPLHWFGLARSIDPARALAILNAYTTAFFEQSLRGHASSPLPAAGDAGPVLAAGDAAYPEVRVDVYPEPGIRHARAIDSPVGRPPRAS